MALKLQDMQSFLLCTKNIEAIVHEDEFRALKRALDLHCTICPKKSCQECTMADTMAHRKFSRTNTVVVEFPIRSFQAKNGKRVRFAQKSDMKKNVQKLDVCFNTFALSTYFGTSLTELKLLPSAVCATPM